MQEPSSDIENREALFARLRTEEYEPAAVPGDPEPKEAIIARPPAREAPDPVVVYGQAPPQISVRLQFPFTIDGLAVESFDFDPPTVADVNAVLAGSIAESDMHARMAGLPSAAWQALRWDDAERVISVARMLAPEIRRY